MFELTSFGEKEVKRRRWDGLRGNRVVKEWLEEVFGGFVGGYYGFGGNGGEGRGKEGGDKNGISSDNKKKEKNNN